MHGPIATLKEIQLSSSTQVCASREGVVAQTALQLENKYLCLATTKLELHLPDKPEEVAMTEKSNNNTSSSLLGDGRMV
jgi:hypothetical protein